jgi:hypothetical protein
MSAPAYHLTQATIALSVARRHVGALKPDVPQGDDGAMQRLVDAINDIAEAEQSVTILQHQEARTDAGREQPAPHANDTTPLPAPPTPAAAESAPCTACGNWTEETDGEQFLCGGCREKGWRR